MKAVSGEYYTRKEGGGGETKPPRSKKFKVGPLDVLTLAGKAGFMALAADDKRSVIESLKKLLP